MVHWTRRPMYVDRLYVTQRNEGRGRISVYDVLRVKERSLSDCLKRTKVNLDRILDAFIKGKYELISEQ